MGLLDSSAWGSKFDMFYNRQDNQSYLPGQCYRLISIFFTFLYLFHFNLFHVISLQMIAES